MKGKIALLVAVILGLVAVLAMRSYLVSKDRELQMKLRPVQVVRAAQRIERGTRITANMIDIREPAVISESQLDQDHILMRDYGFVVGAIAAQEIERGAVIKWSYLRQEDPRLTTQLPAGKVALSLPVDNVTGVAGNIRPGSRVDIIGTFTLPQQRGTGSSTAGEVRTLRMLTQVLVLAVDNRMTVDDAATAGGRTRPYSTVTLAVTPEEAVILTFARLQGSLTLAIRNPTDDLTPEPEEITIANVLSAARRANEARKKEITTTVGVPLPNP